MCDENDSCFNSEQRCVDILKKYIMEQEIPSDYITPLRTYLE